MKSFGIPLPDIFDAPLQPPWIYEDWFNSMDEIMVVTGDPNVGKTTFVGALMLSMAAGRPFFGKPMLADPLRFAYIDLDQGEFATRSGFHNVLNVLGIEREEAAVLDDRIAIVCQGMDPVPAHYDFKVDRKDDVLGQVIDASHADIVVLESWTDMCAGVVDLNDAGEVAQAFKHLRAIRPGTHYWIVHHNTKSKYEAGGKVKKTGMYRGAGSGIMAKVAFRGIDIWAARSNGWQTTNVVECTKARGVAKHPPWEYWYGKNPETGRLEMGRSE